MKAFGDWFKKRPRRGRTRATVILDDVAPAAPPNTPLADESRREQVNFIQSLLDMERKAAVLNTTLAELTLINFNGGRS